MIAFVCRPRPLVGVYDSFEVWKRPCCFQGHISTHFHCHTFSQLGVEDVLARTWCTFWILLDFVASLLTAFCHVLRSQMHSFATFTQQYTALVWPCATRRGHRGLWGVGQRPIWGAQSVGVSTCGSLASQPKSHYAGLQGPHETSSISNGFIFIHFSYMIINHCKSTCPRGSNLLLRSHIERMEK